MRDLGYVDGARPDWTQLLKDAGVGTAKDTVKSRWSSSLGRIDRIKIRAALEQAEAKRKERTKTGGIVHQLERWNEIGRVLSKQPELLARALERNARLAESVRLAEAGREMAAKADELQAEALGSPTPMPTGKRK